MSTVLWANYLLDGVVTSDESDKHALYKHSDKLDSLAAATKLQAFSSLCDSTDMQFNLRDDELPDGVKSTNELMAQNGVWAASQDAVRLLEALLTEIQAKKTRFGLLRNDHDNVVLELQESLAFARKAAAMNAKFNFAIVM